LDCYGQGKNLQKQQAKQDDQDPPDEGQAAAKPCEQLIEAGQMGNARRRCSEHSIGAEPAQMKSSVMGESFEPERRWFDDSAICRRTDVQGIRHNQGAAHPQAMEAADKSDKERGNNV
jgi:hypothetical protein